MAKEEATTTEKLESQLMGILTNEPSRPRKLEHFNVYVIFQRPAFKDKYKGRVWSSKKLRDIGFTNPTEEDPELSYFFRYWGTLNTFVIKILTPNKGGIHKIGGEQYEEYLYNPETDLDYSSLLEKYVLDELYPKGTSEEMFISDMIVEHANWLDESSVEEDDLKNS